jgi:putative ABC transport system ATP-binding protein
MPNLITLRNVSKIFRRGREQVHALNDISLQIQVGEFVAVVGPSGSGKSTLLNIIGAMDLPSKGSVQLVDKELVQLNEKELTHTRANTIGFVFQQFFLQPTLTARENVLLPTLFSKQKQPESRADELLARVGLSDRAHHLPDELSGGEMQRVAIARALINQPKILLADEPTGNLDSQNAQSIYTLLDELHQDGLTIITVTHSEELAARAQHRIYLRDGRIDKEKRNE